MDSNYRLPPARDKLVVHLTINREKKQDEFLEEIRQFLDDLQNELKTLSSPAD